MQSYFGVFYHAKYDTSILHFSGMNYPFGENIFFSVNPPLLGLILYPINNIVDISNYTIGIFNLSILLSLILSSVFLYLIFCRFISKEWQRVILSVLITFVSPQIIRIGGHYALAYLFVVPGIIWFLIKHFEKPSYKLSIVIAIYTFIISSLHLYFFAFSALIWLSFHLYLYLIAKPKSVRQLITSVLHVFIQVILPYLFINVLVSSDSVFLDRTKTPWGLLNFNTNISGVFFPYDKWYTSIISKFVNPASIEWEAKEFMGIVGALGLIYIILKLAKSIFSLNLSKILRPFNNPVIDYLAWLSIISLIVAFAYPLNTSFGTILLDHIGLLKQFRGIARFAWITYISISIVTIYLVFVVKNKTWLNTLCILILFIDAFYPNNSIQNQYNNPIEEIADVNNSTVRNSWLNKININDYQAIITFPFYTNGSENIYDERGSWCLRYGMIVSMKTGIPLLPIHMSRSSLSQVYNNFNLVQEPYRKPEILNHIQKNKKFIVIAFENNFKSNELQFLSECTKIGTSGEYSFYEIGYEQLKNRTDDLFNKKINEIGNCIPVEKADNIWTNNFENFNSNKAYYSKGAFAHPSQHYLTFFEDTIPHAKPGNYVISYWVGNFNRDLIPRGTLEVMLYDKYGRIYETYSTNIGKQFVIIDNDWALIEKTITLNNASDKVKLTVWNTELKTDSNIIDRLLIRPENLNVYEIVNGDLLLNNRYYPKNL